MTKIRKPGSLEK